MILKRIKVETIDPETKFVVKKVSTSDWECLNRKMAVTNQIRKYESQRRQYNKSIFNSQFQTHHIRWDGKKGYWDLENISVANTEAQNNDRIFVAQRQMNWKLWKALTPSQAFNQYEELVNRGLNLPSMNIPLKMTLSEYKQLSNDANSIVSGNQKFMPIISTRHDFAIFPEIIEEMVLQHKFIGVQTYGLTNPREFVNLSALRHANISKKENEDCPIIFAFNHSRHLKNYSYVNSAFAFSCFGIDVFSERQFFIENMPTAMIVEMMKRKPEEFMFYDSIQGGFNKGQDQEGWYETNLTRAVLSSIPVEEGLNGYQSLIWNNTAKQQSDLSILNDKILEKAKIEDYIMNEKSRWATFYSTQVRTRA